MATKRKPVIVSVPDLERVKLMRTALWELLDISEDVQWMAEEGLEDRAYEEFKRFKQALKWLPKRMMSV